MDQCKWSSRRVLGAVRDTFLRCKRIPKEAYNNKSKSADFDLLFIAGLLNAANSVFRALISLRQGATQQGTDSGTSEQVTTAKKEVALGGSLLRAQIYYPKSRVVDETLKRTNEKH
jgi:hypothetical protein